MAADVFNAARGRAVQLLNDNPDSIVVLLLQASEDDGVLNDHDSVQAMLSASGNSEADFTNYARKTGLSETVDEDDANDHVDLDAPDQTWASAGGTTNNTLAKVVVAVQTGADDSTLIPISHHDFAKTTDGSDLKAQFNSEGFYRAG